MQRLAPLLLLITLTGCTGLSREINQALPEFLRSDPGKEEMEIFRQVRQAREWSEEDLAEQDRLVAGIAALREQKKWAEAIDRIEEYLEQFAVSRHDEKVRFWLGDSHFQDDEWERAYNSWRDFSLLHPVSDYNVGLTDTLYLIGREFLAGNRSRFFGIFTRTGVGIRVLNHLIESFPSSPRAADAQWTLAKYYVDEEDWPESEAAFAFIVEQYESSEWYHPSLYYLAYSRYRQVKGDRYDPEMMRQAQSDFEKYLAQAPEGTWRDEAAGIIQELEELRARSVLNVGEWYLDQGKPYSARYYLMATITRFPNSEAAKRAKALLPETPAADEVKPAAGSGASEGVEKPAGATGPDGEGKKDGGR